jgi:hypothetical protein
MQMQMQMQMQKERAVWRVEALPEAPGFRIASVKKRERN